MASKVCGDLYPPLRRARVAQLVLSGMGLVIAMDLGLVSLLIEPMKHELRLTDVQIGLANMTVFYVCNGILSVPAGMLVDHINRTRMLSVALGLFCSGLLLIALSSGMAWFMVGKALMGIAAAVAIPATVSLFSDFFGPESRAMASSGFACGQIIGGTTAILAGGWAFSTLSRAFAVNPDLLGGLTPWRAVLAIFAIIAMMLFVGLATMCEPTRKELGAKERGTFRELWEYRAFLIPLLFGQAFLAGASSEIVSWTAPALTRLYGLQPGDFATWYSIVFFVTGISGVLAGSYAVELVRRSSDWRRVIYPAVLGAFLMAPASCMSLAPSAPGFAFLLSIFGVASAMASVVPSIAINFRIPNGIRGLAVGLCVLCAAAMSAASPPLVGVVSQILGGEQMLGTAMTIVGAPFALLASCFFFIASRAKVAGPAQSSASA